MKIVLDTNVFQNRRFCEWLKKGNHDARISTITYTELLYHYLKKKGKDGREFVDAFLDALKVQVMPFDRECARIASNAAIGRWDFRKKVRDYMIGSLAVKLRCPMITYNVKDFEWISENEIYTPDEFLDAHA
ncbi:putative nucleic acid-binding protein, contains PIN domain [Archaeoglobus sulfaticallidus PM70-1]|uniref:Putative nucleic acid-binding protein, contains PIN domain n=1 Tax=Archaeoglobus sulfaticallidus PM70-1 TaxID=387631 RepID=N0BN08_9EURY|nr:type II toxin-antitoxin system VapC family toxin [Archaeoglobus sulfaticallidus]AGK61675.1 putative nucleic acid-binding protein, contains PIN domain [Archaeoglobus sulfaticallidus PM70-1]